MTKNQIIEKLFTGKNFNDCLSKMKPQHLQEDLKMEVALIVCEWPEEKILKLHEKKVLEFSVVRVILNLIRSDRSPFAKMYRRPFVEMSHELSDCEGEGLEQRRIKEAIEDLAIEEINSLYWYDAEMIRLYMKHGNFRAIQKETGIPFISCYKNIKKSLVILKKKAIEKSHRPLFTKEETDFIQNNKPCQDI
jgi:hypothetical protein